MTLKIGISLKKMENFSMNKTWLIKYNQASLCIRVYKLINKNREIDIDI